MKRVKDLFQDLIDMVASYDDISTVRQEFTYVSGIPLSHYQVEQKGPLQGYSCSKFEDWIAVEEELPSIWIDKGVELHNVQVTWKNSVCTTSLVTGRMVHEDGGKEFSKWRYSRE